ncbi:hypothetical protein B0H13DRAFT_1533852, partial [Mycena leptocephala]
PAGYLFLCPPKDLKTGPSIKWPECPAYWSLDRAGVERLSTEQATQLGFPSIDLKISGWGRSWDATVHDGLNQFHEGKGFDQASREVALHLGYPIYQI